MEWVLELYGKFAPSRGNDFHPEVVKAMDNVLEACKASTVAPGIVYTRGLDHANELIEQGFRFIGGGGDTGYLRTGCRETLAKIKK